ncbi:rCG46286 [Rattus norvegicus]|uniref:RCG46286 n=1 Tax=Rattus norvegicus TaxID=10116 RepID=A6ICR8_RAT|nr:rCG46286 [Rattus norvegicus]
MATTGTIGTVECQLLLLICCRSVRCVCLGHSKEDWKCLRPHHLMRRVDSDLPWLGLTFYISDLEFYFLIIKI